MGAIEKNIHSEFYLRPYTKVGHKNERQSCNNVMKKKIIITQPNHKSGLMRQSMTSEVIFHFKKYFIN